ncbi:MAG: CoxE, partial [Oscillochloris sp.]|nr:CoxE [Oscillochloris sp.]
MDEHVIAFIGALRTAGVRVSVSESLDALNALPEAGIGERTTLRHTLRTTLIKDQGDRPTFERLFDAYFTGVGGALIQLDDTGLTAEDRERIQSALQTTLSQTDSPTLQLLFEALVNGLPGGLAV